MAEKIIQQSRINGRKNLQILEDNLKRRQLFLEEQKKEMFQKEELFFSQQVGKYFKSKSGKRFFKILSYDSESPYAECGVFYIDFFDLNYREEQKDKPTTCYNVFGHDFETQEITEDEYYSALSNSSPKTKTLANANPSEDLI